MDEAVIAASLGDLEQTKPNTALLSFSCTNLPKLNYFGRPAGLCILYEKQGTVLM